MRQIAPSVNELHSFEASLDRFRGALASLERRGIRISLSSRFHGYSSLIQQLLDDPRPAVEFDLAYRASFALREMDELSEIVENLPVSLDAATRRLLNAIHAGDATPDSETGSSAREAQFELYLGTLVRRAGFDAEHGKPDLTIWDGEVRYSLEAKRPGSRARLDDRIRAGEHQLRKAAGHRLLAISMDEVVRPTHGILDVPRPELLDAAIKNLLDGEVTSQLPMLRSRLQKSDIVAVLFTARVPALIKETGHSSLATGLHLEILDSPSSPPVQFVRELAARYFRELQRAAG